MEVGVKHVAAWCDGRMNAQTRFNLIIIFQQYAVT